MWRISAAVNIILIVGSVWTGYSEMAPERLAHENPDALFCALVLVGSTLFSLGVVWHSSRWSRRAMLRRASLRRFSIDWWHDPLQCLFLTCLFMGAAAIGAALRLPASSATGFWLFMSFVCAFLGLFTGQLIAYAIYREHIVET